MNFEVDIPDWVSWIAQDAGGVWYGYAGKPQKYPDGIWDNRGQLIELAHGAKPKDWTQELYEVIR